jgi:hypothetical protein
MGLTTKLVALGATYIGIRTATRSMESLGRAALEVNSNVEDMIVRLAALTAQIEQVSFEEATRTGQGLFRTLNDIAVQSPATAAQLMEIFQGAYGPMRAAGAAVSDLTRFSQNAASVATVMGRSYAEATRDIRLMAVGRAEADVATFTYLRSIGLITETTREWNEMARRDSAAATRRLLEVFEELGGPAADAFGRTWTGVSSTFRGLVQQFLRVFSGPTFEVLKTNLRRINEFLLRYRDNIENVLTVAGRNMAIVFDRFSKKFRSTFVFVVANLGTIIKMIEILIVRLIASVREIMPKVIQIAKKLAIFGLILKVAGPLMMALSGLSSLVSAIAGLAGVGGGAAAAGAGGAAAAGGGAAAGAVGGGFTAMLGGALATLAPIALAVGAVFASLYAAIAKFGGRFKAMFVPLKADLVAIGRNLKDIFSDLWDFLKPGFTLLGTIIISLVATFLRFLIPAIRNVVSIIRVFARVLGWLGRHIIGPILVGFAFAVTRVAAKIQWLFGHISRLGQLIEGIVGRRRGGRVTPGEMPYDVQVIEDQGQEQSGMLSGILSRLQAIWTQGEVSNRLQMQQNTAAFDQLMHMRLMSGQMIGVHIPISGTGGAPPERPTRNIDMRGSRITIRQEFREADPDRVWIQMREGLEAEVVHRVESGFAPALTR